MKSMAEYALENKALIKLFIAFLVIGGLWSFYSMSKMEDPEITWKIQCKLPPKTKRFCPLVLK